MKPLNEQLFTEFVYQEVDNFLDARLQTLDKMRLKDILSKNPYLFRAKNLAGIEDLIESMIEARLSSSEEKKFGDFLERLAIFVASQTANGRKSSARGIDLEFERDHTRYLIAIKSGPNWGNSSQYQSLETNFKQAVVVQKQAHSGFIIQPVLGICYGKSPTVDNGIYIRIAGQNFWEFLSGQSNLYETIMTLIGQRTDLFQRNFLVKRTELKNRLIQEFIENFADQDASIDWLKVIRFNSGNGRLS